MPRSGYAAWASFDPQDVVKDPFLFSAMVIELKNKVRIYFSEHNKTFKSWSMSFAESDVYPLVIVTVQGDWNEVEWTREELEARGVVLPEATDA